MPVWQSAEDQTAVSQTLIYAHSFRRTPFSVYYNLAECAAECAASLHSVYTRRKFRSRAECDARAERALDRELEPASCPGPSHLSEWEGPG